MTSIQLIQLLEDEFRNIIIGNKNGEKKSILEAIELVETFKNQIQHETIKNFIEEYKNWIPDADARYIAAEKIIRNIDSGKL